MQKRKKRHLDGIDREILRCLYKRGSLVSSEIAMLVGLSSSAIGPRLNNLKDQGIIRYAKISGERIYRRYFGQKKITIKSPRSIYWEIDFIS